MATKIKANIDVAILSELGLGIPNKEIAEHYGVSPSYVSKIKNGKKVPYIYLHDSVNTDGNELLERICNNSSIEDKQVIVKYLQNKVKTSINEIKIYTSIINIINKEINDGR